LSGILDQVDHLSEVVDLIGKGGSLAPCKSWEFKRLEVDHLLEVVDLPGKGRPLKRELFTEKTGPGPIISTFF
jgi:hypothetical protein